MPRVRGAGLGTRGRGGYGGSRISKAYARAGGAVIAPVLRTMQQHEIAVTARALGDAWRANPQISVRSLEAERVRAALRAGGSFRSALVRAEGFLVDAGMTPGRAADFLLA